MSKKNQREQNKRRQRKDEKKRVGRAQKERRAKAPPVDPALQAFQRDLYLPFLMHGANYIASPYEEGLWKPLFEADQAPLDQETILKRVMRLFWDDDTETWKPGSKPIAAWVLVSPKVAFTFYKEAVKVGGEAVFHAPNPFVWELFHKVRSRLSDQ